MKLRYTGQIKRLSKPATLLFLCVVYTFTTFSVFFVATKPGFAANSNIALDKDRRRLRAARACFNRTDIIDTDDKVSGSGWNDLYEDLMRDRANQERIVMGFDMDSQNGIMTCNTVMASGVLVAFKGREFLEIRINTIDDAKQVIVCKYAGIEDCSKSTNFQAGLSVTNSGNDNSEAWVRSINNVYDDIQAPGNDLRVQRILKLIDICFVPYPDEPNGYDSGRGDFQVDGLGSFTQNREIDWKSFGWIRENSGTFSNTNAELGDIDLGFAGASGGLAQSGTFNQDNSDSSSDFFPVGGDIDLRVNGGDYKDDDTGGDAIVDCHWVKKNKDWIFNSAATKNEWSIVDGELKFGSQVVARPDGEDSGENGEATDGLEASCDFLSVSPLNWILCPIYELMEGAATQLANGIESMLDFTINDNARVVWASFRTIANIMFVLALLAIILSQTLGGKM